jgi:hypothetical protein
MENLNNSIFIFLTIINWEILCYLSKFTDLTSLTIINHENLLKIGNLKYNKLRTFD